MSKDATAAVGEGEEGGQPPINPAAMTGGSHVRARAREAAAEDWMDGYAAPEHRHDRAYDADQLIDGFMAGARWAEEQCAAIHHEEQVLWNQRWQEVGEIVTDAAALLRGYEAHHRARADNNLATIQWRIANGKFLDDNPETERQRVESAEKADRNARMAERLEAWLVGVERPAVVARVRESGDHGETWVVGEEGPDAPRVGDGGGEFSEVVRSLVRDAQKGDDLLGTSDVDAAQRIHAYYRAHPVEPARTLTERQYQCAYWRHLGVLTINASGEIPKSIEVNGKRYLPDQQKDPTDVEFGAEMMPEARCPHPPRERPVQEIESYDPVPVDRAVEPRVGAPERHNDQTVDGFMVGTRWPDQPREEWRGRNRPRAWDGRSATLENEMALGVEEYRARQRGDPGGHARRESIVEGMALHRPGGVADLTALRLTTGDPVFDPRKRLTVNGYLFHPDFARATLREEIVGELLRLRPSTLAEGEQIDQACCDQADAILALLGLGDS